MQYFLQESVKLLGDTIFTGERNFICIFLNAILLKESVVFLRVQQKKQKRKIPHEPHYFYERTQSFLGECNTFTCKQTFLPEYAKFLGGTQGFCERTQRFSGEHKTFAR